MSYFFIINTRAGKNSADIAGKIEASFSARKLKYSVAFTRCKGHARELSRRALINGYANIAAVGGDGTIREVAEALVGREANLCVLPAGSGNGLARNLFIPLDIEKSIEGAVNWKPRKIDVGLADGNPFFCAAGFGLDAHVARLFNSNSKRRGIFPYIYFSFRSFLKYEPYKIGVGADGKTTTYSPLVLGILNGREYGGGARIAPEARLDDGFFDMVVVNKASFLRSLAALPDLFNGKLLRHGDFVSASKIRNVTVMTPPKTPYHLDGEDFESSGEVRIAILEKSLNVKAP